MDKLITSGHGFKAATLLAMVAGLSAGVADAAPFRMPAPKRVRNYPMPVISSPEEIAAWNDRVVARTPKRESKKDRRALVKVHGRRQAIKALKHWRHEHKNANEHY